METTNTKPTKLNGNLVLNRSEGDITVFTDTLTGREFQIRVQNIRQGQVDLTIMDPNFYFKVERPERLAKLASQKSVK